MPGLPDSMQMAPHGRFETVSEDDHGSNGEIRRVRFAENEHEEELHADARPSRIRARMTHWSQQDGPLTRGFARQREIAQARPVPPPRMLEEREPLPASPHWIQEDDLHLQGSHIRSDASRVRFASPPDFHRDWEAQSAAPQWLQNIQAGKPANRTAGLHTKLLYEASSMQCYPHNYAPPTAAQSILEQSNLEVSYDEKAFDMYSRNNTNIHTSSEAAHQYINPIPLQSSSDQHNIDNKDDSRRAKHSGSHSKKRKRPRVEADFDEPLNKARRLAKQSRTKISNDIDSFGLQPEDRRRKSSEEPYAEWSTLAFIQHLKKSKGPAGPHVAATDSENVPSAYTKFQPVWRPQPRNTVVTSAKFTLPVRKSANAKPTTDPRGSTVSIAETSKRGLFKPEKPATSSPVAEAITPRKLGGKAARALASLNDQHSVVKAFGVYEPPKPQAPVQPSKFVLYKTSRLHPENTVDTSPTVDHAASSEVDHHDMEPSSPPTSPSPDYSRNMHVVQNTRPNYSSRSLRRTASSAEAVSKKNSSPRETESAAADKSIIKAYEGDVQDEYGVQDEHDVQEEGDQYPAYDEMSHRNRKTNENEQDFGQAAVEDPHTDEAEHSLGQFGEGHGTYHRGNAGYAEVDHNQSHRSFHQPAVGDSQYKPGWLSTFWRR